MENGTKVNEAVCGRRGSDAARSQFIIYAILLAAMFVTFLAMVGGAGTLLWQALK
jgi:hypothetical protein